MRAGAGPEHSPGEGQTDPRTTSGAREATPPCGHHRPPGSEQPLLGEARDVRAQTVRLVVASPLLRATVPLAEMLSGTPSYGGRGWRQSRCLPACLGLSLRRGPVTRRGVRPGPGDPLTLETNLCLNKRAGPGLLAPQRPATGPSRGPRASAHVSRPFLP